MSSISSIVDDQLAKDVRALVAHIADHERDDFLSYLAERGEDVGPLEAADDEDEPVWAAACAPGAPGGGHIYAVYWRVRRAIERRKPETVETLHPLHAVDVGATLHLRGRDGHLYEARITRRLSGDATIAQSQNQSAREELIEVLTAAFYEIATVDAGGEESGGWCCTNGRTTAVDYGERLVELGVFERDTTRGIGRVQWFRPIKTPA